MYVPASSCLLVSILYEGGSRLCLVSQWTPGFILTNGCHFPTPLLHIHPYVGCGRGHLPQQVKRTNLSAGEIATCDPTLCLQPKLPQVPKRKDPCENKVLLFFLTSRSFPHMIGSQIPCQLGKVFTILELSNLPGDIKEQKKYRKTTLTWGFFPPWF